MQGRILLVMLLRILNAKSATLKDTQEMFYRGRSWLEINETRP